MTAITQPRVHVQKNKGALSRVKLATFQGTDHDPKCLVDNLKYNLHNTPTKSSDAVTMTSATCGSTTTAMKPRRPPVVTTDSTKPRHVTLYEMKYEDKVIFL